MSALSPLPNLLTIDEVAKLLRVRRETLWRWSHARNGPPSIRMGGARRGRVLYDLDAVKVWLSRRTVTPTAELAPRLARTRRPRAPKAAKAGVRA